MHALLIRLKGGRNPRGFSRRALSSPSSLGGYRKAPFGSFAANFISKNLPSGGARLYGSSSPLSFPKDSLLSALSPTDDTVTTMEEDKESTTAKFNVGGQIYEVARSLLDQYPTSMLSCAAAKSLKEKSTIFIEGNGERFQYCLDYMRRQQVHLPMNIPENALLSDLDYYGIQDVDPSLVNGGCFASEAAQLFETMKKMDERHAQMKDQLKEKLDCIEVSTDCFSRFVKTGEMKVVFRKSDDEEVYNRVRKVCLSRYHRDKLDDCLSVYGMYVAYENDSYAREPEPYYTVRLGILAEKKESDK